MATYQHTETTDIMDDAGRLTIKYNVTPASGAIGPGTMVTVSGQISGGTKALKSIGIGLDGSDGSTMHMMHQRMYAYVNKSIAKGATVTFAISFTVSANHWASVVERNANVPVNILFFFGTKAMKASYVDNADFCPEICGSGAGYDFYQPDHRALFTMPTYEPTNPVLAAPVVTDEAAVSALTVLGNIVTVHSLPRVSGAWAYDSRYPDQLGHVALVLTGAMTGTYEVDVGSGVTSAAFDLAVPTQAGTVNWTYTVTDMFGNVATASGSFAVLSYSPPEINAWMPERYHVVITPTGPATEEADDGERVWVTILANIASVNQCNAWTATLTAWRAGEPEIDPVEGTARAEDPTGAVAAIASWSLGGSDGQSVELRRNEGQLYDLTLSASLSWRLRLTITDALGNSATVVSDDIEKAGAMFDVEPGGVAVGQRVTSQESAPRFQCALSAEFYGDVAVSAGGLLKKVTLTRPSSISVAANDAANADFTFNQSAIGTGWTAIGVVGYNTGQNRIFVCNYAVSGTSVTLRLRSVHTAALTVTPTVTVLCVRTSL